MTNVRKKQVTGFSDYWKAKNIYDMAGNTWEWICEKITNDSSLGIIRGGCYDDDGSDIPVSYRDDYESSNVVVVSFRVALFVM